MTGVARDRAVGRLDLGLGRADDAVERDALALAGRVRREQVGLVAGEPVERVDEQHRERDAHRQVGRALAAGGGQREAEREDLAAAVALRGDDRVAHRVRERDSPCLASIANTLLLSM